jgi:hypothetical protein
VPCNCIGSVCHWKRPSLALGQKDTDSSSNGEGSMGNERDRAIDACILVPLMFRDLSNFGALTEH